MHFISSSLSKLTILAILFQLLLNVGVEAAPLNTKEKKQNIIFMVSDGLGAAGLGLTRQYQQIQEDAQTPYTLFIEDYLVGTLRTGSNSSYITDSAAAGTALADGEKTYNGAIGVDVDGKPIGSLGEALKVAGYKVGIVVTTSVGDATPAVWGAHALSRKNQSLIAEQLLGLNHPLGRIPDVLIGGGREYFQSNSTNPNGVRSDGRDLIQEITADDATEVWTYSGDRESFDALDKGNNVQLPLLGLYTEGDYPYAIDRNNSIPSLAEQTEVAINALEEATKESDKGFFLMVEGSRIDHAGHANDSPALVRETIEYDDVYRQVVEWADASDVDTVIISLSDHETGGVTINASKKGDYQAIANATHSGEHLQDQIIGFEDKNDDAKFEEFLKSEIIEEGLGIYDYTEEEVQSLRDIQADEDQKHPNYVAHITNLTNSRAKVGFGSLEHTAVDILVYAHANNDRLAYKVRDPTTGFTGAHDNTDFVKFVNSITDIDLEDVTEKIQDIQVIE